jgi:ribosomal protein S12 methylthiotransferase accessory factor
VSGESLDGWHRSRFTGLFTEFGPARIRAHDPDAAIHSGMVLPCGPRSESLPAGGAAWDESGAELACLGEAIERLQAYRLPCDGFREASFADWNFSEPAIDPARWVLFHREQYAQPGFPFEPLTRASVCRWICFRDARSGEPCWIPDDMAFLFSAGKHRFAPLISTGLSCARWGGAALLRGLQEVIERDGVVGAWWNRYALEEWESAAVFGALDPGIETRVARPNLTYRFYCVDSPFSSNITIVTIVGEDREGFCFSAGSACRETLAESWNKSILEAINGRHFVRYLKSNARRGNRVPQSFAEHALYYSLHPEELPRTVFQQAKPSRDADFAAEDLGVLSRRLGEGRPVLFRVMTPPGIAQEFRDWHVLRVVVPGLQPLHGSHDFPFLGGELWKPRGLADWKSMPPHPFP